MIEELVQRLIDAGASPNVAAATVAQAFAAGMTAATSTGSPVDTAAEKRRAYDRDRKARERDGKRKSGGSPVESGGSPKEALTLSFSPQKDSTEKEKKVRARKIPCPPDWHPSDSHFAKAAELQISRSAVLAKAEDMRLWAKSSGALKMDWDATFHGFLRRDAEKLRGKNESSGNVIAAADRLVERMRQFDERPGEVRGGEGAPPVRLLSSG